MGTLHRITASKLDLANICIRSTDREGRVLEAGPYSVLGSAGHAALTASQAIGWGPALERVPEHLRDAVADIDRASIEAALMGGAYAWGVWLLWCFRGGHAGEARILGQGMTRSQAHELAAGLVAPLDGDWLVGEADLMGRSGDTVYAPDMKLGHEKPPPVLLQAAAYGLMAALATGATRVIHGPLWAPGGQRAKWSWTAEENLLELEERITALYDRIDRNAALPAAKREPPVAGDHCKYCPVARSCAATRATIQTVLAEPVQATITSENAAQAYGLLRQLDRYREALDGALRAFAGTQQASFDLPKGRRFGPYIDRERWILPGRVLAALDALGLPREDEVVVVRQSVPLAAFLRHARERTGKTEKEVLAALEEAGALKITETPAVGAHWPSQEEKQ